jgi:hypothetical protein
MMKGRREVVVEEEAHLLPGVAEDPLSRSVEQEDLALQEGEEGEGGEGGKWEGRVYG